MQRLDGRGEFGSICVRTQLSFIRLLTFPLAMNDFHITAFEVDYIRSHTWSYGAEFYIMNGWSDGAVQLLKERPFPSFGG